MMAQFESTEFRKTETDKTGTNKTMTDKAGTNITKINETENGMTERVRIGIEVGEHGHNYESLTKDIAAKFDLKKLSFVLIYMSPVEIPERLWYEWAEFFRENDIHFAFLYTQQRGAPKGKISHLTVDIVEEIKRIAGEYFLGDMIGETGGLASWQEGYYEDIGMDKPEFKNMSEAKQHYVDHVASRVKIDKDLKLPAVLAVEATTFSHYNFEAGVDNTFIEMMCGNPEIMFASARGASKAHNRNWWASHIAQEWYGGFRNDDPLKYKRMKLAYYYSFMAGAKYIYPESGHFKIESYGDNYGLESPFCEAYRKAWDEFADFLQQHERPVGGPKVKIGFIQGNLDSWTGWGGATVWNQFRKEEWTYGASERGWDYLDEIFKSEKWHVPTVYGENDLTGSIPYGQYDIVPAEASIETLKQYSCLIMLGWNTMTPDIYNNLKQYVFQGGKLFLSVPHLNTSDVRDDVRNGDFQLINNGDYSDLFGCKVRGKGMTVNWGVKFIEESSIPGYLYPYTKSGYCDPICACGTVCCADIEVAGGRTIAIMADKFHKWRDASPVLLVENKYGKGYASLITSWDYPGANGLEKFMKVLLKAIISGEQQSTDIKVIGSDKIHYAVYDNSGCGCNTGTDCSMDNHTVDCSVISHNINDYVVYLLNTDYNVPAIAKIEYRGKTTEVKIEPCGFEIAYIK